MRVDEQIRAAFLGKIEVVGRRLVNLDEALQAACEEVARNTRDEIATMHEDAALVCNRDRDPGMANHHRIWAKRIRDAS